eukprot:CAMPEP_0201570042 /NCGR_PEP_ID=MMETSP0190_2-20130828/12105_1 /ASSEMBLY_ACC=CAM_ASM_000263 /TAXON_ID=37353 /ORGANISM="Rosalina sp." /LENGTH=348 /DNA_ID=CAMNT_0047993153 /DNA_START=50 /DNA_END=1097 /DNA_ORIENTATION=+
MYQIPKNIFGFSGRNKYPLKYLQSQIHADSNELSSITGYLDSIGCSDPDQVSKIMVHDLMTLKSPASQIMMDVYSQSKYPEFPEFVNNTSLCHFREDNIDLFTLFQQYQYYYNKDICLPMQQYLSSNQQSFGGNPNKMLIQLSEIFDHCKNRAIRMPNNCSQQVDVMFSLQSSQANDRSKDEQKENDEAHPLLSFLITEDSDDDDDDEDPAYTAQLDHYYQTVHSKQVDNNTEPIKSTKDKPDITNANANANDAAIDPKMFESFKKHTLAKGMDRTMREEFKAMNKFDKFEPYTYLRHEMFIGEESIQTLTADDKVPQLSPENTPLFRHYHTINAMKKMANHLKQQLV